MGDYSTWTRLPTWLKWVLGILGGTALAGIFNAIWEVAGRPLLLWCLNSVYSATLFGFERLRDLVYLEAATGFKESLSILLAMLAALGLVNLAALRVSRRHEVVYGLVGRDYYGWFSFVFAGFLMLQSFQVIYINEVIAKFNQSILILAPHLADDEEEIWRARFASMRTGKQYDALVHDLNALAATKGVKLSFGKLGY